MKKTLCLLIALAILTFCFVGCQKKAEQPTISLEKITFSSPATASEEASASALEDTSADVSASEETSVSVEPEPQKITVSTVEDIRQIPILYVENFIKLDSFKSVTVGATNAIIEQSIDTLTLKRGDYAFTNSKSSSLLVNTEHTAYFHLDKVLYKDKDDTEYETAEINAYLEVYGVYPIGKAIEGFVISEETVLSVEKNPEKECSFIIKLDGEKAGGANKIQMKKYGSLEVYPTYKSAQLIVTMTEDFMPVTVELSTVYTVDYGFLGEIECKQDYTVTYSQVNGEVSFPEEDNFNKI